MQLSFQLSSPVRMHLGRLRVEAAADLNRLCLHTGTSTAVGPTWWEILTCKTVTAYPLVGMGSL